MTKPRPPRPRPRAPGRPVADGVDQRARLMDAALACYGRHGIAATPLRAIAREAGVNAALVHYYFGDKADLTRAVIAERFMPVLGQLRGTLSAPQADDPREFVLAFVHTACELIEAHPWLPPIWVREILTDGGALRGVLLDQMGPALADAVRTRFARAQAAGRLNAGLDPRLLLVSLVGLTMFPAAGAPVWRRLFDADDLDMAAVARHARALLLGGIAPSPGA